jgi:hypothetical protein
MFARENLSGTNDSFLFTIKAVVPVLTGTTRRARAVTWTLAKVTFSGRTKTFDYHLLQKLLAPLEQCQGA